MYMKTTVKCQVSSTLVTKRLIIQKNMVKYYYINVKKIFRFFKNFGVRGVV